MKQLLRYFSVGLFSAGIIMLIGLYFTDTRDIEEYTAEELIPLVEKDGYHVLNNEEYISLTLNPNNEEENTQDNKSEEKDTTKDVNESEGEKNETSEEKEADEEPAEEITNYTLTIEDGMVTSTISSLLEENNIIDDAREFNDYLDDNDYSLLVQIGKFELKSDMSFYELAEAITR